MLRVTVALLGFAAGAAVAADPKDELKPLAGVWVLDEAVLAGRDHTDDFPGMKLTVTGAKFVLDLGPNSDTGTITVDVAKSPKHIDLTTRADGPFKGRKLPGVYDLKDGKFVVCLDSQAKARPTAFEAPEKTTLMLLTFKRDKK